MRVVTVSVSELGSAVAFAELPENARQIRENEIPPEWNDDI